MAAISTAGTGKGGGGGRAGSDGYTFVPARSGRSGGWVGVLIASVVVSGFLPLIFSFYYGIVWRNVQFIVGPDGLEVPFAVGRIVVAAEDIAAVELVLEPPRMSRMAGASLGDFQMGWYRLANFGRVYRLTTGRGPYVFVDTAEDARPPTSKAGVRYVFSPADAGTFVTWLENARQGRGPEDATVFSAYAGQSANTALLALAIIGFVVAVPFGIVLPALLIRGRRGMRYHVGPEGITVHHLGRKQYRWEDIRRVFVREERLKGLLRTFGAALPGYYVGKFSATSLGGIQMNASRLEPPFVVVETKKTKVVLTPEDPGEFMRAVERYSATV